MIQELLGGTAALIGGGERKISITGVLEGSASPSPSPSPSASTSSTTTTTTPTNASENQNLRCPRCDSSNTKFCYYNNYNLTQPRHFCKTCRRYWTKGGALRNVPIGGGCRKNKGTAVTTAIGKTSNGKVKTLSSEIGKPGFVGGYDHELPSNPVLWPSPQNSHLMALLRSVQNPDSNPNPSPNPMNNSIYVKEEAVLIGSHMASDPAAVFNGRTLGPDTFSQVPSIGLCSPFYRNNQQQAQQLQLSQQQQQNGFLLGEVQNSGIQELYQRLRLSANYYHDHAPVIHGNMASTTSAPSSTILESAPVSGGEFGYWNPTLSWPDLPTTNGAYP